MTTKVIFRKFNDDGSVIALFPRIPADTKGYKCESYMHVGQHAAADPGIVSTTKLAKPSEYESLLKELKAIGYREIEVGKKITPEDNEYRMKLARKQWGKM